MRLPALLLLAASCAACSSGPAYRGAPSADRGELPWSAEAPHFRILGAGVAGAGQPDLGSFPRLRERGYATVINLRTPREYDETAEARAAAEAGLEYFNIPVTGRSLELADALRLQAALARAPAGAVLVHCRSGNRVGALWGLYRALEEGLPPDEALAAARLAGYRGDWAATAFAAALAPLNAREKARWSD